MASILRVKRLEAGLSQSGLAEKSGVNVRILQYYEQGRKDLSKAATVTVYRLAEVLGCTIEELIERPKLGVEK